MYFTMVWASAKARAGCAVIGTVPQWPEPPLITLLAKVSIFASVAGYFAAMSRNDGPITLLSTLWQVPQSLAAINFAPGAVDVPEFSVPVLLALVSTLDSDSLAVWLAAAVLSVLPVFELPPQAAKAALINTKAKIFFM